MTERERLIAILRVPIYPHLDADPAEVVADYLLDNGVTLPKHGRWIIHSNGKRANATNWAECSECHVCGSPSWKVCPVCETKMDMPNITENTMNALKRMGEKVHRED